MALSSAQSAREATRRIVPPGSARSPPRSTIIPDTPKARSLQARSRTAVCCRSRAQVGRGSERVPDLHVLARREPRARRDDERAQAWSAAPQVMQRSSTTPSRQECPQCSRPDRPAGVTIVRALMAQPELDCLPCTDGRARSRHTFRAVRLDRPLLTGRPHAPADARTSRTAPCG